MLSLKLKIYNIDIDKVNFFSSSSKLFIYNDLFPFIGRLMTLNFVQIE